MTPRAQPVTRAIQEYNSNFHSDDATSAHFFWGSCGLLLMWCLWTFLEFEVGVYWQQNDKNRKTTTLWTYPGAQEENDDPEAQIMILHHVNHDACTIWTLHLPTFAKAVFIEAYGVVVLFFGGFKGTLSVYNVNIYKYTLPKFHVVHLKIMVDTKFGIYYSRVPFSGYSTCSTFWGYVYWMIIKNSIYNDW